MTEPRDFEEFWPLYVGAHRNPACRGLHYLGTSLALLAAARGLWTLELRWALYAVVVGYGLAWIGHFFVENNRPATFGHFWWSLRGDLRMLRLALRGRMADEVIRLYGSRNPPPDAPLRRAARL